MFSVKHFTFITSFTKLVASTELFTHTFDEGLYETSVIRHKYRDSGGGAIFFLIFFEIFLLLFFHYSSHTSWV